MLVNMIYDRQVYSNYARRILSDISIMEKSTLYTEIKYLVRIRHRKISAISIRRQFVSKLMFTGKSIIYRKNLNTEFNAKFNMYIHQQ